jgi:hypothetical protein
MTTKYYSSFYDVTPYQNGSLYTPRAPNVITRGVPFTTMGTFTLAAAVVPTIGDQILLLPAVPSGFKLSRFCITVPDLDSGTTITANLGWQSQALGVGIVTGLDTTALRGGGTISVTDAAILAQTAAGGAVTATTNLQAIGATDTLIIYISASATGAGTNGVAQFLVEGILPSD